MADNNNDNKFCLPDVNASVIQQMYKLITEEGKVKDKNVFPISILQAIYDGTTGTRLDEILSLNNYWYLPYTKDKATTRLKLQQGIRRRGLLVSFRDVSNNSYIEKYIGDKYDDTSWADDANWIGVFDSFNDNENIKQLKEYLVNYINDNLTEFNTNLENFKTEINSKFDEHKQEVEQGISEFEETVNHTVDDFKNDMTGKFEELKQKLIKDLLT